MSRGPRLTRCAAADVRLEVFVDEQNVPFVEEIDARDFEASTIHLLARGADGTPLATGRILLEMRPPRMARFEDSFF